MIPSALQRRPILTAWLASGSFVTAVLFVIQVAATGHA